MKVNMFSAVTESIDTYRAGRIMARSRYRTATQDIPSSVYAYWKRTAHLEFEGIPKSRVFFARAVEGLLIFFACVRGSGRQCGLPSAAADSVWHAWAARAPGSLDRFCLKYFGQVIPHVEEADMRPQMADALATCMVQARLQEQRDPVLPSVPELFALDRKLRMPRGYGYEVAFGAVAVRRLNDSGKPHGQRRYQNGLDGVQLLGAGLISQEMYDQHFKHNASAGGACGSGTGSSGTSDGGGANCDSGGGDSGGSCGGGCGGGCGS